MKGSFREFRYYCPDQKLVYNANCPFLSRQNLVSLLIKDNAEQQVPYTFKRCLEADVVRYIQQNFRADKTLPWKVCCCNTTGNLLAGRCVDPEFWKMLENSSGEQFKCFIDVSFEYCYIGNDLFCLPVNSKHDSSFFKSRALNDVSPSGNIPAKGLGLHNSFYKSCVTQELCCTRVVLHKSCVTQELCYTRVVLHKSCVTQELCCTRVVSHKSCVTQELCCTRVVLHKSCVTQELSYIRVVLHKSCVAQELCYTRVVLHKSCVAQELCYTRVVLHMS